MASAGDLPNDDFETNTDDKNLELFDVLWLDAVNDVTEIKKTTKRVRSVINHLKRFPDVKQCQEYIEQTPQESRLILIVSGRFGRELVPIIHQFRQIRSIYVYCMDRESNLKWASEFKKVKDVVVTLDELISRLTEDYKIQIQIEEPLSFNMFKTSVGPSKSSSGGNRQFVYFQILIDCLLQLKSTQTDKDELFGLFKSEYNKNKKELANLEEFQHHYSAEKALWWYTKESYFNKTLNAALCTGDIHMIVLFRSYIGDIHRQLQKFQSKNRLKVYRSQIISADELQTFQKHIGQFISINSLFSASTDHQKTLSYLDTSDSSGDLIRVLFEINANPRMVSSKPFAAPSEQSEFVDKLEVLFMIGSIYQLESIKHDDNQQMWIIQMTLCGDDEHGLKQIFLHMKEQIGIGEESTLQTLGKVLYKMGKFDLAENYFRRLLKELPSDDPLRCNLYEDFAELASQREDFNMMVEWRQKSVAFKNEYHLSSNPNSYGASKSLEQLLSSTHIDMNTKWMQNGVTVAGGNDQGNQLNQLSCPCGLYIDDDNKCIFISEWENHRIVEWKYGANNGQVVAGKNGLGCRTDQLDKPTDVVFDKKNDSLIICDYKNRRIVRRSRQKTTGGDTIISDIDCFGLTIDKNGDLYVSDWKNNEVRRWKLGETNGALVAGGNGQGDRLHQLNCPTYIFVDDDCSIYVSDCDNNRVMKWPKGAREGIIVAGGHGEGTSLRQLTNPQGLTVDHFGNIYVADCSNDRIMRWSKGSREGSIIVGGNGEGDHPNQFSDLRSLSFDRQGSLYVVDCGNHRVQKFNIDLN